MYDWALPFPILKPDMEKYPAYGEGMEMIKELEREEEEKLKQKKLS